MNRMVRYQLIKIYRDAYFSLERDMVSSSPVFTIRRARGAADYEERYRISETELKRFLLDDELISAFALLVDKRILEDRLIPLSPEEPTDRQPDTSQEAGGRYDVVFVNRAGRYALERDPVTGQPVFSIPVTNQSAEYTEWYEISEAEFDRFVSDENAAREFAGRCGRRELDDRLVLQPGADRGVYD